MTDINYIISKEKISSLLNALSEEKEEIRKRVAKDTEIFNDEFNTLIEMNRIFANTIQYYMEYLAKYRRKVSLYKHKLNILEGKLFAYYKGYEEIVKGEFGKLLNIKISSSGDVQTVMNQDSRYYLLKSLIIEYEETMKYLNDVISNLSSKRYDIKNIIELMKLEEVT